MKKIGIALLPMIVLLLAACSDPADRKEKPDTTQKIIETENDTVYHEPPDMIILEGSDIQQLKVLDQNDHQMVEAFSKSASDGAFQNRENVLTFLEILSPLLVPEMEGMHLTSITYLPDRPSVYFVYSGNQNSIWYRFEYVFHSDTVKQVMADIVQENQETETISDNVKLLMTVPIDDSELAKHYAECWLDIHGVLVKGIYSNQQENIANTDSKTALEHMNAVPLIQTDT